MGQILGGEDFIIIKKPVETALMLSLQVLVICLNVRAE